MQGMDSRPAASSFWRGMRQVRRRNRKEPEGKVLANVDETRWLPDQSRDKATSSKLHMGQRSKFLMLLRPMPGYMAGKRKGVQRKLLINWTHSKGRHHPATNQQAVPAKTPPGNITTYWKRTICNWHTNKRGGQPRSGDPGLGYPPLLLLADPQHISCSGSAAKPNGSGTPTTNQQQTKQRNPTKNGSAAEGRRPCMMPARSQRDAQNGTKQ